MGWLGLILFLVLLCTSVGAWINTKIILEDMEKIKRHIGLPEEKPTEFINSINNDEK